MAEKELEILQRHHRFEFTEFPPLQIIVQRIGFKPTEPEPSMADAQPEFFADLADFSGGGLRLYLPFEASYLERLAVRLELANLDFSFETEAVVRHVRSDDQQWIAGCSLDTPLPQALIDYLASAVGKDRRLTPRDPVWGRGTLKRDNQGTPSPVEFLNLSSSGFCAKGSVVPLAGERVKFLVHDKSQTLQQITARIRWTRQIDGEADAHLIGCSFTENSGYPKMKAALSMQKTESSLKPESESYISGYIVAACLLSMLIPPSISIAVDIARNRAAVAAAPAPTRDSKQKIAHPIATSAPRTTPIPDPDKLQKRVTTSKPSPDLRTLKPRSTPKPAPISIPSPYLIQDFGNGTTHISENQDASKENLIGLSILQRQAETLKLLTTTSSRRNQMGTLQPSP